MYPYAVLHNQICDKYEDCPAAKNCPQRAIISHPQNEFGIDADMCNGCAICQEHCNLFLVVNNDLELHNFHSWIKDDPRNESLFRVERFSADIVDDDWCEIKITDVKGFIESHKEYFDDISIIELVNPQNAVCLAHAVPVAEVIEGRRFAKVRVSDMADIPSTWNISMLPAILIFKGDRLLGKYEGRIAAADPFDLEEKKNWLYNFIKEECAHA